MIRFDESGWPVLVVHFEGHVTDEQFLEYLEHLNEVLGRRTRYAIVLDATNAEVTSLKHQRMQANWMRVHRSELAELCAGTAVVFTSSVFRLVLSGVFALQPPPMPYAVCESLGEGLAWAAKQLGVEVPKPSGAWDVEETTRPGRSS
jgi:hypothetical protein